MVEPVNTQRGVDQRVQQHRQGAEQYDGGYRDGGVLGTRLEHRAARHHGCGAADGAAGADQQGAFARQLEPALADPPGNGQGAGDHQDVDDQRGRAEGGDVLEGQAQAVEHHAQAQQLLARQVDAGADAAEAGEAEIAGQQADEDRQGQAAEPKVLQRGDFHELAGAEGDGQAEQGAGDVVGQAAKGVHDRLLV
jgi:hypothetical protein